jgi:putative oxidoreductase
MKMRLAKIIDTGDKPVLMARLIVGIVFLSEGIQKFLFPALLGTGRFQHIGFSHPEFWASFTGVFEIICSLLIILGLLSRLSSFPLLIVMITAFITTKLPILEMHGFWSFMHEHRTDFCMTMLLLFILYYGGGSLSIDRLIYGKNE